MSEFGERVVAGTASGALVAALVLMIVLARRVPEQLMRTNVSVRLVPVVLGAPVVVAGVVVALVRLFFGGDVEARFGAALAIAIGVTAIGGLADDLRGSEESSGFAGHLRAAGHGRVTGGLVKIAAGGVAGIVAGLIVADGWAAVEVALAVALWANVVNLFDRAPGRAAKVWLLVAVPVALWGGEAWTLGAAGMLGAVLVCLPVDLGERAMLGDAGSNPLGAVAGLGLAASFDRPGRIAVIVVAVALNLASERWSFSRAIEATPGLRALDRLGRRRDRPGNLSP
ncbi:MAG: hypothetical protein ACRDJV_08630 [Actinomycetota bacterium]